MYDQARFAGLQERLSIERVANPVPPGRFRGGSAASFDGAFAENVDFSGLTFTYLATDGSSFIDCDFSRVRIEAGYLDSHRTSTFVRCRFDRLRPGSMIWGSSRFERCSFLDMRIKDWRVDVAEFTDCTFSGRIDGISFWAAPQPPYDRPERLVPYRLRNELCGNDFTRVDLHFPEFHGGVDVSANSWPSDPDYLFLDRWQQRRRAAIATVAKWNDAGERERALWWLRLHPYSEQGEVLVRKSDWGSMKPVGTWERLWSAMVAEPLDGE